MVCPVQLLSAELQDEDAEKVEIHLEFALKQVCRTLDFPVGCLTHAHTFLSSPSLSVTVYFWSSTGIP